MRRPKILVIDNYDSFVYNLVQYLAQIGADVEVWRNDDPRFADTTIASGLDGILLSPGPGIPEDAGMCIDVVKSQAGRVPIFGVCLGLQSIGVAYGGVVDRAPELLHGKTSLIHHHGAGVLAGLPSPFTATRYHSLAIEPATLPTELEITATTASGVIMAIRHRELAVEAVQFHRVGPHRRRLSDAGELACDLRRHGSPVPGRRHGSLDVCARSAAHCRFQQMQPRISRCACCQGPAPARGRLGRVAPQNSRTDNAA